MISARNIHKTPLQQVSKPNYSSFILKSRRSPLILAAKSDFRILTTLQTEAVGNSQSTSPLSEISPPAGLERRVMFSTRMSQFAQSLLLAASAFGLSGCASMSSNMANSSGMGYYEKGNYAAASREFQMALMNEPNNPDYLANFAKSRQKMGDVSGAEQHFRQALTVAPDHQPSYHGLAELMLAQGRSHEAQAMLTTWASTQPYTPDAHVELAWLQHEMGNTQGAAQSLQQALQINPNHSAALAHMGQFYEEMGHPEQAVAMYQNSLRSDWNQPDVHSRLAAASQRAGASSPMSATAMARGMHPYSVARQPSLMGPPSAGSQMAQMQIGQQQMAAGMMPHGNTMSPMPSQMAMSSMPPGMMSGYYSPSVMSAAPQMMASPMASMNPASSSGWTVSAPMTTNPAQTASFDNAFPVPNGSSMTYPMETIIQPSSGPTPSTATKAPTPDPAFSAVSAPVSTISLSQSAPVSTSSSQTEPPLVEAF